MMGGPGIQTQVLRHYPTPRLPTVPLVLFEHKISDNNNMENKELVDNNKKTRARFECSNRGVTHNRLLPLSVAKSFDNLYLRTTSVATALPVLKITYKRYK